MWSGRGFSGRWVLPIWAEKCEQNTNMKAVFSGDGWWKWGESDEEWWQLFYWKEWNKRLIGSRTCFYVMRKILMLAFFIVLLPMALVSSSAAVTSGGSKTCDCSGDLYNCADFTTTSAAQSCYDYCISQGKGDVHRLDADKDGLACESGTAKTSSKKSIESSGSSSEGSCPSGKCYVNGYRKKSGTYVNGYCRKC